MNSTGHGTPTVANQRITCPYCEYEIAPLTDDVCDHYIGISSASVFQDLSPRVADFWAPLGPLMRHLSIWGPPPTERDRFVRHNAPNHLAVFLPRLRHEPPPLLAWITRGRGEVRPYGDGHSALFSQHALRDTRRIRDNAAELLQWINDRLPPTTIDPDGRLYGERLIGTINGRGRIALSTLLLGLADQAAAPADERAVLDGTCAGWFGADYATTRSNYRRLLGIHDSLPDIIALPSLHVRRMLDAAALTTLLDRLRYQITLRDVLDCICGREADGNPLHALDRLCQRCFAHSYNDALEAYWQLFPYGLPFYSDEMLAPARRATRLRAIAAGDS